jgi:hypothetical protein
VRGQRDRGGARLAAHGRGPRRVARGELRRERAGHDARAAAACEPEDADHRALLERHRGVRRKTRLSGLEEKGLDGGSGGRKKPAPTLG